MNEMKVALSQVVRNFRIYLDEETPKSKMQVRLILQSQDGIHVKFQAIKDWLLVKQVLSSLIIEMYFMM